MPITVDEEGNEFVLTVQYNGKPIEIRLSDEDVLALSRSALSFQERILSKRNPRATSVSAVMAIIVENFRLHADSLDQDILLSLQSPNGRQLTFVFQLPQAQRLLNELPVEIARVQRSNPTKQ